MDDHELLRDYALHRSERAFAELVERHLPLVYATARRLVRDPAAAEDVAQTVFIQLARKAALVRPGTLPGWLYHTAKCAAVDYLRRESCRRRRETEAVKIAETTDEAAVAWEQLAPLVDDALSQLNPVDQSAILLRFFDGRSMADTGRALDLSEPAAQKRVSRALEKMRAYFARQGVTASAALLATTLGTQAAIPPPADLAGKITGPSLAGAASQTGGMGGFFLLLRILFMSTKTKTTVTIAVVALLIILTIAGFWWYTQPATVPVKVATTTGSFKSTIDPKSPALHPPPSPPIVLPPSKAPQPSTSDAPPPAASITDPQANLNTALKDIARLIRANDEVGQTKTYMPPALLPLMRRTPEQTEALRQQGYAKDAEVQHWSDAELRAEIQQFNEAQARAIESLADQTPTVNANGDEATYMYTPPPNTLDPFMPATNNDPVPWVMVKLNGKWYHLPGGMNHLPANLGGSAN